MIIQHQFPNQLNNSKRKLKSINNLIIILSLVEYKLLLRIPRKAKKRENLVGREALGMKSKSQDILNLELDKLLLRNIRLLLFFFFF